MSSPLVRLTGAPVSATSTRRVALVVCLLFSAAVAIACGGGPSRPPVTAPGDSGEGVAAVLCAQAPRARDIGRHLEAARDALARLDEPTLIAESREAASLARAIQEDLAALGGDDPTARPGYGPSEDALVKGLLSVASWGSASGSLFEYGLTAVPPSEQEEWISIFSAGLGALEELGRRYAGADLAACWDEGQSNAPGSTS